nr:AAC_HP1_G0006640.mRNA.1.CDS.1 [Saccharomyces cerevisiae]
MTQSQIKQKLSSLGLSTNEPVDEAELKRQLLSWDVSHNKTPKIVATKGGISKLMIMKSNGNLLHIGNYLKISKTINLIGKDGWLCFGRILLGLIREAKMKIKTGSSDSSGSVGHSNDGDGVEKVQSDQGTEDQQMEKDQDTVINEDRVAGERNLPNEDSTDADSSRELMDLNEYSKDPTQ